MQESEIAVCWCLTGEGIPKYHSCGAAINALLRDYSKTYATGD